MIISNDMKSCRPFCKSHLWFIGVLDTIHDVKNVLEVTVSRSVHREMRKKNFSGKHFLVDRGMLYTNISKTKQN